MNKIEKYLGEAGQDLSYPVMDIRININKLMDEVYKAKKNFVNNMKNIDTKNLNPGQKSSIRDFIDNYNQVDLNRFMKDQIWQ